VAVSKKRYPEHRRRVKFFGHLTGKTFIFLTNNFEIDVLDIVKCTKNAGRYSCPSNG